MTAETQVAEREPHFNEGDRVGEYVLEAFLGAGSFGEVYRARKSGVTGHQRALKMIELESRRGNADGADARRGWQSEWKRLEAIRSPTIVAYYDADVVESGPAVGWAYIATELCDASLDAVIRKSGGRIADSEGERLLRDMLTALIALRDAPSGESVHRDVKPGNILRRRNQWKLCDFGTARLAPALTGGAHTTVIGTTAYMSAGALRGVQDHAADLYALGVSLHQALTGTLLHPWPIGMTRDRYRQIVLAREPTISSRLPARWRTTIAALIGRHGAHDARELLEWFERTRGNVPPDAASTRGTQPVGPDGHMWRWPSLPPRLRRRPRPWTPAPTHAPGVFWEAPSFHLAALAVTAGVVCELIGGFPIGYLLTTGPWTTPRPLTVSYVVLAGPGAIALAVGTLLALALILLGAAGLARAAALVAAAGAVWATLLSLNHDSLDPAGLPLLAQVALAFYAVGALAAASACFRGRLPGST